MAGIESPSTGNGVEVDALQKAMRTTGRPLDHLAWHSVSLQSGALTGVGAGGLIFSFQNTGSNLIAIRKFGMGFITTTAFTTPQELQLGARIVRGFGTGLTDTGGAAAAITGNNCKHRVSNAAPTGVSLRTANTGALTAAATRTPDSNYLAILTRWSAAAGDGITPAIDNVIRAEGHDYPIILAPQEALTVLNIVAMGAAGVITFTPNIQFAEIASGILN